MRVPDRPWADTDSDGGDSRSGGPDYRATSARLAERLARLLAGHPSAEPTDDPFPDGRDHDDGDTDDLSPGGPDSADISPGGPPDNGLKPHRRPDSSGWDSLNGEGLGAYRPWFSADGASDPWFAEPTDGTSQ